MAHLNFGKKISVIAGILTVVGISFGAGLYVNYERATASDITVTGGLGAAPRPDLGIFWKVWDVMEKKHITSGTKDAVTAEKKLEGAIQGLVGSLNDPYSEFLAKEEKAELESELSGNIEGIGATIGVRNDFLTIIAPLKGSPAEKAGLRAGDVVYKINGEESASLKVNEAVKKIRGKKGTKVEITVVRKDVKEPIVFSVTRDMIVVPTLETEVLEGKVFKITLYEFNALSASMFKDAMQKFKDGGYQKLILDLRNNPGGYLDSAVDIASYFIPAGKIVVSEDYGTKRPKSEHRSKGFDALFGANKKMVVLINNGSASASEILAGALADYNVATLVGETSFGKGSVQELIPLTKELGLKLTVAYWYTPKNKSISKGGLTPEYIVKPTEEDLKSKNDPQQKKALQILNTK